MASGAQYPWEPALGSSVAIGKRVGRPKLPDRPLSFLLVVALVVGPTTCVYLSFRGFLVIVLPLLHEFGILSKHLTKTPMFCVRLHGASGLGLYVVQSIISVSMVVVTTWLCIPLLLFVHVIDVLPFFRSSGCVPRST